MNTSNAIDEFIAERGHRVSEQPTHHRYILTLFGLYGRPAGKTIPVAVIIKLLAELEAESSSVRSSISRLKKRGVLVSQKTKAGSSYALLKELEPHMQSGDNRIFSPLVASIRDPWLLVSFSVPESERSNRHKIRTGLHRMGFGTVTAGLYIGPIRLKTTATEYIREHKLWDYIDFFISETSGHTDIKSKVSQWWDLKTLENEYLSFLDIYELEVKKWQSHLRDGTGLSSEAFRLYVAMMTQWRGLPFLDPGLPPELLPANWAGIAARKVFNDLHRLLKSPAADYFNQTINEANE